MYYLCNRKRNQIQTKNNKTMKKFLIQFKEVSYGVVEVFAETEEEARELAECEGVRMVDSSEMELYGVESEEDIDSDY